jgi:hypothetical protein
MVKCRRMRLTFLQVKACYVLEAGALAGISFNPENKGDVFLRNVC